MRFMEWAAGANRSPVMGPGWARCWGGMGSISCHISSVPHFFHLLPPNTCRGKHSSFRTSLSRKCEVLCVWHVPSTWKLFGNLEVEKKSPAWRSGNFSLWEMTATLLQSFNEKLGGLIFSEPSYPFSPYHTIAINLSFVLHFLIYLFIWKSRRENHLSLAGYPSNGCNVQGWTRPKPGSWNPTQVLHVGVQGPGTLTIFYYFPRHIRRELNWKQSSWELVFQ